MSCRTTAAGRLSVSFLKHSYGFTESQAMSLYHSTLRKFRENEIPSEEIDSSYERSLSEIGTAIQSEISNPAKRDMLAIKLAEVHFQNPEPNHKFAITQLIRTGDTAKAMIDTSILLAHRRQNIILEIEEIQNNYRALMTEYHEHKDYIENSQDTFRILPLLDGYPQDRATTYAINAINNSLRCIHCGRFVGVATIHTCPTTSDNLNSETLVIANSIPNERLSATTAQEQTTPQSSSRKLSYSEPVIPMSMEEFQERYDRAKIRIAEGHPVPELPIQEDGLITAGIARRNGGNTFGIELEVDFPNETLDEDEEYYDEDEEPSFYSRHNLASDLYNKGITISPHILRWHYVGDNDRPGGEYADAVNGWICEFDRSVDPYQGARGVEIKSQILYDEVATWENIKKIAESLQRHNAKPTPRTGMHINVGGSEFSNTNPTAHNSLLRLAAAYDDVLIRLAHNPASARQHRGRGYCSAAYLPPEGYGNISSARAHSNHYQAFNLGHLPSEGEPHRNSSRVEVRFWDAAVDLGRIQSAVAISTALVELALRNQDPHQERQESGYHAQRFGIQKMTGENWEEATLSFRKFLSLMEIAGLKSEAHKEAFMHLFAESRWTRN